MKFAKVLFFICAIGLCAAVERSTAEIAAEYKAETEALRVKVGYKEMFTRFNTEATTGSYFLSQNYPAKVSVSGENGQTIDCTLQTALFSSGFNSGVPLFSNNWAALNKGAFKHLIKSSNNVYYLPFNTINSSRFDGETILFVINNKFGPNTILVNLTGVDEDFVIAIKSGIDTKRQMRKTHIVSSFNNVIEMALMARMAQKKIKKAQDSDAQKKADMQAEITKLKTELAQLRAKLVTLKALQVTQSQTLQVSESKLSETTIKKTKKITEKLSIEKTIKTLESQVSPQQIIEKLKKDKEEAKKNLEYWLKGAVYHRVINESEKTGLLAIVLQNDAFDKKVDDYFFPQ